MSRCGRCGRPRASYCLRLGRVVCWHCYHGAIKTADAAQAERIARQREIADALRTVAAGITSRPRAEALAARALLINTAQSDAEVAELIAEVEALGIALENGHLPTVVDGGSARHRQSLAWIGRRFGSRR